MDLALVGYAAALGTIVLLLVLPSPAEAERRIGQENERKEARTGPDLLSDGAAESR